jgi:ribosome-binding protein aMBF1 (putative translation factor)
MEVTTTHATSSYGQPVILGDDGLVMDYAPGIKAIRERLELSTTELAKHCGVSRRTVEGWEQGRLPNAAALNVIGYLLSTHPSKDRKGLAGDPD